MGSSIRVVVVTDTAVGGAALARAERLDLVVVGSVEAALEQVGGGGSVDCVVTDHDPPVVDALAVLAGVTEHAPGVPVVVATTNGSEELACDAVAAGAAQYVPHAPDTEDGTLLDLVVETVAGESPAEPGVDGVVPDDGSLPTPALVEQYETVVETVPVGVFVLDDEGRILGGNERGAELIGASQAELVGTSVLSLVEDGVFENAALDRYAETVEHLRAGETDAEVGQFQFTARPGETPRTYEVRIALRSTSPDESYSGTVGIVRDVTERERRRDELERYETVITSLADPVWVVDGEGYGLYVNPAYEDRFGWTREAVESGEVHFADTLSEASTQDIYEVTGELLAGENERATLEVEMVTADGRVLPVEDHLALLPSDEGFRGMAGVARDVSDRKRRERRLQVLKRVLRHNLGNDMTVIAGYADMLAGEATDPEQVARAETIHDVAERLVDASRKVRKLEEIIDHVPTDRRAIDVAALVDAAVSRLRGEYPEAVFTVDRPENLYVAGHEGLQHAVEQVLENAVEHNDAATPRVHVGVGHRDGWIRFTVADDGPGTPKQERRIVDDGDVTPVDHGTGVGLWVIKLVVESLDGEMTIRDGSTDDSEHDDMGEVEYDGTVVVLRLPVAEP
ncbi:PAS domain S-box protein [Haloarchaeobius sp. DT45]|uniref:PAS domain-containing protein n=1 Tax=Haloarchaeobius sp. DT45 TaxID=3446116 RepID=UPI003F6CEE2D